MKMAKKKVAFKNKAPFSLCILKINNTLIDNVEDLDIVMPMYSLLEYSDNYLVTFGRLWNYCRDEVDGVDDNVSKAKLCPKHYVPVITLAINDNIKFLENIKQGFKRKISWNKYRSKITIQPKNNNLDYMNDPTFRNINRLFVFSFKNGDNDSAKNCFVKYYMLLVEMKDFNRQKNVLINP